MVATLLLLISLMRLGACDDVGCWICDRDHGACVFDVTIKMDECKDESLGAMLFGSPVSSADQRVKISSKYHECVRKCKYKSTCFECSTYNNCGEDTINCMAAPDPKDGNCYEDRCPLSNHYKTTTECHANCKPCWTCGQTGKAPKCYQFYLHTGTKTCEEMGYYDSVGDCTNAGCGIDCYKCRRKLDMMDVFCNGEVCCSKVSVPCADAGECTCAGNGFASSPAECVGGTTLPNGKVIQKCKVAPTQTFRCVNSKCVPAASIFGVPFTVDCCGAVSGHCESKAQEVHSVLHSKLGCKLNCGSSGQQK